MSIFSVNKNAKSQALQYEALATDLQGQQRDVNFARTLLSNIRQERIARAQLRASAYSDDTVSSSAIGALANIDSALAGEMGYSYETSERMEKIQDYNLKAQEQWKKYQKSIQKAGVAGQIMGTVGTIAGALVAGPAGAMVGAAIGGAAGVGLTSAMGGGHVATGAATRSAISGTITAGIGQMTTPAVEGDIAYETLSDTGVREVVRKAPTFMQKVKGYGGMYYKTAASAWQAGGYNNEMRGMW